MPPQPARGGSCSNHATPRDVKPGLGPGGGWGSSHIPQGWFWGRGFRFASSIWGLVMPWDLALKGALAQGESPQVATGAGVSESGDWAWPQVHKLEFSPCHLLPGWVWARHFPSLGLVPPFCSWGLEQPPKGTSISEFLMICVYSVLSWLCREYVGNEETVEGWLVISPENLQPWGTLLLR